MSAAGAASETGVDGNDDDNDDDEDNVVLFLVPLATSGTTSPSLFTSSSLCRVTRSTITPPMLTGRSNATGVSRPVRPTCKVVHGGENIVRVVGRGRRMMRRRIRLMRF